MLCSYAKFGTFFVAQATSFKMCGELPNSHSKYCMLGAALFYLAGAKQHNWLHDVNRAAPAIFLMHLSRLEYAKSTSKHIQN
jgi:hypothetical protein